MRKLTFLVITIAVLAGLWLAFKPQPISPNRVEPAVQQTPAKPAATNTARFVFDINNAVVNGPDALRVRQGDTVDIQITSDTPDEAHLHGYDLQAELQPGIAAHLLFSADKSGRFELELHRGHRTIGALEVYPKP